MTDIMIVGEAWGKDEEAAQQAFVGYTGRILRAMLRQVGIDPSKCYFTNVFNLRPYPTNDVKNLCGTKAEGIPNLPYLVRGKYVLTKYEGEINRLFAEINKVNPRLIIACGATPAWALLHTTGIATLRGAPVYSHLTRPDDETQYKVFPTFHPAAVARDWKLRPVVLSDLMKAKYESTFPEICRPNRTIWLEPTIKDIGNFYEEYIVPSSDLSIDIETHGKQITCIGFAPAVDKALVIPFYDPRQKDGNYWRSLDEELAVWDIVRHFCSLDKNVTGQNFMYDMRFLWENYGIPVPHHREDTMLRHHAMQPEMRKSLDFLASIYTDEPKWKFMGRGGVFTRKQED